MILHILWHLHHPVINVVVAGNLSAVVSVEFYNLWEIVINSIKFQILFPTPIDSLCQSIAGAASPENKFITILLSFLEVCNQCLVGLAKFWPIAVTKSAIKIYGNSLKIDYGIIHDQCLLCLLMS